MVEENAGQGDPAKGKQSPQTDHTPKMVEILVDNLGPDLLKKGTRTDDPKVIALLKTEKGRKLVREVKE